MRGRWRLLLLMMAAGLWPVLRPYTPAQAARLPVLNAGISAGVSDDTDPAVDPQDAHDQGHLRLGGKAHALPAAGTPRAAEFHGASAVASSVPGFGSGPLTYHGGPLLTTSRTYAIFWLPAGQHFEAAADATSDANFEAIVKRYFGSVGNTSYTNVVTQYSVPGTSIANSSTFGGAYVDASPYPGGKGTSAAPLLDTDFENEVSHAVGLAGWSGGSNAVFFIYTGLDVESCFDSTQTACSATDNVGTPFYCAYHSNTTSGNLHYANITDSSSGCYADGSNPSYTSPNGDRYADNAANLTAHEHFETITDPDTHSGWLDSAGFEIGDKCVWIFGPASATGANVTLNGSGFKLQEMYSNADAGCVLSFAPSAPGAPTGVAATPGNGRATVSWSAPATTGGSKITAYTVTALPGGKVAKTDGKTAATVEGLINGTAYTFTVTATNAIGTGPSSARSASVTPATVPGRPTDVVATPGVGQETVQWKAPASNGGSPITSYTVRANPGGVTVTVAGSTTTATVTGLSNGTDYHFTVLATNSAGNGPESEPSKPGRTLVVVPSTPTDVKAEQKGDNLTVRWTEPEDDGGAPITRFTIVALSNGVAFGDPVTAGGEHTKSVDVHHLADGSAYTFTVQATNSAGAGPVSAPSNSVTIEPHGPATPGGVNQ